MPDLITFENFKAGDIIITTEGSKGVVLEKLTNIFARSSWNDHKIFQEWVSIEDAKRQRWNFMQESKLPMSREEVEAQFNIKLTN